MVVNTQLTDNNNQHVNNDIPRGENHLFTRIADAAARGWHYLRLLGTTELRFQFSELAIPPDVSQYRRLHHLHLECNHLTIPPDISQNRQLTHLHLFANQLTRAPGCSQNRQLIEINLDNNQLTIAPDLSHNLQLKKLGLSRNQFTELPNLSCHRRLRLLDINQNRLTELPDWILSLPRGTIVNAYGNHFSADYIHAFQMRLQAHRLRHPRQGPALLLSSDSQTESTASKLPDQLLIWGQIFQEAFPQNCLERPNISQSYVEQHFAPLLSLDEAVQNDFATYLYRLINIQDCLSGGQSLKNIIQRVDRMLQLALKNEGFRGEMLALIQEGLTSCDDRILIIFNDIEILSQFYEKELPFEDFQNLCLRAQRYEELKSYAQNYCSQHGLGDEIETILHFQIALAPKGKLNLPITTKGMLHQDSSGVNAIALRIANRAIARIPKEQLLAHSNRWLKYVKEKNVPEVELLREKYVQVLEDLANYFDSTNKEEFLKDYPDLNTFLENARKKGVAPSYNELATFSGKEMDREILALPMK